MMMKDDFNYLLCYLFPGGFSVLSDTVTIMVGVTVEVATVAMVTSHWVMEDMDTVEEEVAEGATADNFTEVSESLSLKPRRRREIN